MPLVPYNDDSANNVTFMSFPKKLWSLEIQDRKPKIAFFRHLAIYYDQGCLESFKMPKIV